MRASSSWLLVVVLGACTPGKPTPESAEASPSSGTSSSPAASASAAPAVATDVTWTGTYASEPGSLYVVDGGEWAAVKWRGDDASSGLGEGSLALTIQGATKRVAGTSSGPLGDLILNGTLDGEALAISVLRKDPLDRGLTGTAIGRVSGDHLAGTMRLSLPDARVIREARFTLARSKP